MTLRDELQDYCNFQESQALRGIEGTALRWDTVVACILQLQLHLALPWQYGLQFQTLVLQLRVPSESAVEAPRTAAAPPQRPVLRGIFGRARQAERAQALILRTELHNLAHT